MEIVIHGTNDGYDSLHSTNIDVEKVIKNDLRIGTNDDGSLGESVYSLGFFASGLAYSKYIIVKDTIRSSGMGFIAFTLFLEHNKSLEASNIKKLLDELSESYSEKYIVNNYLNRGEEKKLIQEDWSFVKNILDNYNEQSRSINYQQKTGSNDPALLYFKDTPELLDYFDKPYQEEYENFKQIFFLASNQKDRNTNPTNVLRNSGQELNINLNNYYYKILNLDPSSRVIIKVNNKSIDANTLIRDNSSLEISYSTNNQLYETIEEKGRLLDVRIKKYLSKEGNGIRINYEAFTEQIPKTKTITIEPKKEGGTYFNPNLKLTCKVSNTSETLPVFNNKIDFKGEQINKQWKIKATGLHDHEEAPPIDITPLYKNSPVVFNIRTKKQTIARPKKYSYDTGNHGSLKQGAADYSSNKEGDSTIIKPNRGYEFTGWEFNDSKRTLVAQYEKSNKYKLKLIGKSFIALFLIFLIVKLTAVLIDYNSPEIEPYPDYQVIKDYTEGNELLLHQLSKYEQELDDNPPITSDDNWFSKLFDKKLDTTNDKSWDRTYLLLKRAIISRTKIDEKKFNELDLLNFSENQEGFVNAVKEIKTDTLNYEKVVEDLGDVSSMGLNNIKDTISDILEKINSQKEEDTKNAEKEAQIAKAKEEAKKQQQKQEQQNKKENEKLNFIKQLKRDDITKDELNNLLKKYPEFKSQIKQYLKFFEIATKKDFDVFKDFKKSLTNNKNKDYFKDTPLLEFIKEICKEDNGESSNFLVYKSLRGRTTITSLKELIEKYNKKNN
jgi:hypothetical protein